MLALLNAAQDGESLSLCVHGSASGFLPWHEHSREASREDGIAGRKVQAAVCRMETFISWGSLVLL